jgi:D-tyrosyl-tRNA(Tyr) deacylase
VRVVVQRVARATVRRVDTPAGDERRIEHGLVLLAAFRVEDDDSALRWMAEKCLSLRIFPDADGALNRSVAEAEGALLVIPNFTLYGDARKGRRPSFTRAAPPAAAEALFETFVDALRRGPAAVESGFFQAHMLVEIVNDGPVTLILERDPE